MNFGDILDKWEKKNKGTGTEELFFDRENEKSEISSDISERSLRRSRLLKKKPDASIDLHGLKSDEARTALEYFFNNSRSRGHEKVLIIHGKGNHINGNGSLPGSILKDLTRNFIENCPFAGESGYSHAKDGGSGATWVILKSISN